MRRARALAAVLAMAGLAAGGAWAQAAAPPAASLAVAREIIDVAIPRERRLQVFGAAVNASVAQTRANALARITDKGLRRLVEQRIDGVPGKLRPVIVRHAPAIAEALARAYAREFTLAELTQINAFAHTPAGSHYLAHSTEISSDEDVAAANKSYLTEAGRILVGEQQSISSAARAYIANHPEAAPRN